MDESAERSPSTSRSPKQTHALRLQAPKSRGSGRSGPRRRTGCLTCRARKVRCDEGKPSCTNCDRLRLKCVYKPPIALPSWTSSRRSVDSTAAHAAHSSQTAPTPSMGPASAAASQRSSDLNFFGTVLRSDDHYRTIPAPTTPVRRLPGDTESYPPELGGSFDMLGFMGGITSELEQKHLDLTSGLSAFTTSPSAQSLPAGMSAGVTEDGQLIAERYTSFSPDGSSSLVDGMSIGSASDAATTHGSLSDLGSTTYEEQLLHHFLAVDPPAAIFGPVSMEWKYVRPSVLANARDYSPLLNALYCYSDVHKAVLEGKRWRWAPAYYRVASSGLQACLLGYVTDSTLVKVFAAVFFLMLSEVGLVCSILNDESTHRYTAALLLSRAFFSSHIISTLIIPPSATISRPHSALDRARASPSVMDFSARCQVFDCRP